MLQSTTFVESAVAEVGPCILSEHLRTLFIWTPHVRASKLILCRRMEFSDFESCMQDFSDLGAEYKVLEVSVPMFETKGMM